ncbi:MAG: gamma-glutamyl-gamma-aminobutyrate hydrolase family protein [Nannocystaceae bacterium]|nr:gamma-glutamyl-gamma-aminobutyrate hydrolase family protein [bacterium]
MTDSARPLIGVSCNFMHADPDRALFRGKTLQYVEARMAKAVWRAGGHPVLLVELDDPAAIEAQVRSLDGLLLTGGADVAPSSYGETPMQPQWGGDPIRDAYEIDLIRRAEAAGRPVLGICRGVQVIAAAFGGTLYQDINTQLEGTLVHRDWHRYDQLGHDVRLSPDSWVSRVYGGADTIGVNSIHHQSIKEPPPGFEVTAVAPDGVLEAIERLEHGRWVVGVQWHPEWLEADRVATDPDAASWNEGGPIFEAFVRQCSEA